MNSYELSRTWFDYCFENPELIKPNHTALYFFCVEHCNRLGWKEKFGLPTSMAKEALGIKSYNTYINTLNDLVYWGFVKMIEKSKNQYSSNIIALSNFNKALDKALDKALIKHGSKQRESTDQSIDSIIKQLNNKQLNNKQLNKIRDILLKYDKKETNVILPYDSIEFKTAWEHWKDYKHKEHKFTYKTDSSEQAALIKLSKISEENEETAILIITESIANGWKGLFKHKNNDRNNQTSEQRLSQEQINYLISNKDI